jgi:hypothetical protein
MSIEPAPGAVWRHGTPAKPETLTALQSAYPAVPSAYVELLRTESGAEGDLGIAPGWVQIWPAERVLEFNASHRVAEFLPDFVGFGTNGGDELLAFDTRSAPWGIVRVPRIGMWQSGAIKLASDFPMLTREFGRVPPTA